MDYSKKDHRDIVKVEDLPRILEELGCDFPEATLKYAQDIIDDPEIELEITIGEMRAIMIAYDEGLRDGRKVPA